MRKPLFYLAMVGLAFFLSACASFQPAPPQEMAPPAQSHLSDEQPPFAKQDYASPRPAPTPLPAHEGTWREETITRTKVEKLTIKVTGESSTARETGLADLWSTYINAYYPDVYAMPVYDDSVKGKVLIDVDGIPEAHGEVHISKPLKRRLIDFSKNPDEGEGLTQVCKSQAENTTRAIRIAREYSKVTQKHETIVRPVATPQVRDSSCPSCQPAGYVPNKTIWAAFFIKGVPVDLVDASPTGGRDAFGRPYPDKEIGSGASKIWTDGSGTAHVQMVRYGGNVSPANWAKMQDVAEYLVTIVRQYDGAPHKQCPYYFFKP